MPERLSPCWTAISLLFISALAAQQNADDLWTVSVKRAEELDAERRFPEAAEAAKLALQSARSFDPMDPRRAIAYLSLGVVYRNWGQCDQSRTNLVSAVRIWKQQTNPEAKYVFATLSTLVSEVTECGDPAGAEHLFHAYDRDLQRLRSGPLDDAMITLLQGEISRRQGRYRQAELLLRQALQIMERTHGANPARIAEIRSTLSVVMTNLGRPEHALGEAQRAVADLEQIDALHPALPNALNTVGYALFKAGRKQESARIYQRALGLAHEIFGDDSLITAVIMINYAVLLKAVKRPFEAEAMNRQGQDAYRRFSLRNVQTIDIEELRHRGSAR